MQKILLLLATALVFVLLFFGFFHPITAINQDLGRHLLLGKIITQTHAVPNINLLSFTNPDYPFINSHWLSEVIFYLMYAKFGFSGLLSLTIVISLVSFLIIFLFSAKRSGLLPATITAALYIRILFERTDVRPEMFSLLFVAIFIVLLYRFKQQPTKLILLIIPLEMLWVNLHIYFFIGIVLIALFLLEHIIKQKARFNPATKLLSLTLLLSLLATCINPNGINGALFPLMVLHNYALPVMENQNTLFLQNLFNQPGILYFEVSLGLLFVFLLLQKRKAALIDWLLFLTFSLAGILVFRNLPLFVYATFIAFATGLSFVSKPLLKRLQTTIGKPYCIILKHYCLIIFALLLCAQVGFLLSDRHIGPGIEEDGKKATDFFLTHKLQGNLYNNFDFGGYLSYRIYPQKVFIDNRPEAYPKEFVNNIYLASQTEPKVFEKVAKHYHIQTILLSHWDQTPWKNPFLAYLLNKSSFVPVYLDDYALILVNKNFDANKKLITNYAFNETSFHIPKSVTTEELIRYLYFFEKVGWNKQAETTKKLLMKRDPQGCLLQKYTTIIKKDSNFRHPGKFCNAERIQDLFPQKH